MFQISCFQLAKDADVVVLSRRSIAAEWRAEWKSRFLLMYSTLLKSKVFHPCMLSFDLF